MRFLMERTRLTLQDHVIREDAWYRDLCQARSAAASDGEYDGGAKRGGYGKEGLDHGFIVAIQARHWVKDSRWA